MADFPTSDVSGAVSTLISNVLPPKSYTYLFAFVPGLFFEISILLAEPELICRLTQRLQETLPVGFYVMLCIALFFALLIGNAFLLLVTLIQRALAILRLPYLWDLLRSLRRRDQLHPQPGPDDTEDLRQCWALFARQLVQTRYGIKLQDIDQAEWNVLYDTLGRPTNEDTRGSLLMIATEATGWCGLAAMQIASALKNRYYLAFCAFMIAAGLLHDFYVARNLGTPRGLGLLKIRAILREFSKPTPAKDQASPSQPPPSQPQGNLT